METRPRTRKRLSERIPESLSVLAFLVAGDSPYLAACSFSIWGRVSGMEFKIELKSFVWRPSEQIDFFANVSATPERVHLYLFCLWQWKLWIFTYFFTQPFLCWSFTRSLGSKNLVNYQNKHWIRKKRKEHVEQPFLFFPFANQVNKFRFSLFSYFFFFEKERERVLMNLDREKGKRKKL